MTYADPESLTAYPVPAWGTCFLELGSPSDIGGLFKCLSLTSPKGCQTESIELSIGCGTLAVSACPRGVQRFRLSGEKWNARVRIVYPSVAIRKLRK